MEGVTVNGFESLVESSEEDLLTATGCCCGCLDKLTEDVLTDEGFDGVAEEVEGDFSCAAGVTLIGLWLTFSGWDSSVMATALGAVDGACTRPLSVDRTVLSTTDDEYAPVGVDDEDDDKVDGCANDNVACDSCFSFSSSLLLPLLSLILPLLISSSSTSETAVFLRGETDLTSLPSTSKVLK